MTFIQHLPETLVDETSDDLSSRFSRINQAQEEINSARDAGFIDEQLAKRIGNQILIQIVHSSNAIEGNKLSLRETQALLENTIQAEKYGKDGTEAISLRAAIEYLEKIVGETRELSVTDLFDLHQILMRDLVQTGSGEIRNHDVVISGSEHVPPSSIHVQQELSDLFKWYRESNDHPITKACILHHGLTWIHPFTDGNGRISRLILNYSLLKSGYTPAIVSLENRAKYYEALTTADGINNDKSYVPLVTLICQSISQSQEIYNREILDKKAAESINLFDEKEADEQLQRVKEKGSYDFQTWISQMESFRRMLENVINAEEGKLKQYGLGATVRSDYDSITVEDYLMTKKGEGPEHGKWMFRLVLTNHSSGTQLSVAFQLYLHKAYAKKTLFEQTNYFRNAIADRVALKFNYRVRDVSDRDTRSALAVLNEGFLFDRLELNKEKQTSFQLKNSLTKKWVPMNGMQAPTMTFLKVLIKYIQKN